MNIDYEIKTDNDGIDFEEVAEILHFHGLSDLDTETQKKVFLNSYAVVYLISEGKITSDLEELSRMAFARRRYIILPYGMNIEEMVLAKL